MYLDLFKAYLLKIPLELSELKCPVYGECVLHEEVPQCPQGAHRVVVVSYTLPQPRHRQLSVPV